MSKMASAEDIMKEIEENKKNRLDLLNLSNKLLEVKLNYLLALKDHSREFLSLNTECIISRNNSLLNKLELTLYQVKMQSIKVTLANLNGEISSLDAELAQVSSKLDQVKRLDPKLLSEYRELTEDLEMQEMLIQISDLNQQ